MTYEALPPTGGPTGDQPTGSALRSNDADRGLVVLNYIFLLVAPFTLHVLAVVAVILAYVRLPAASAFEAGHYGLQIKVFWWSVLLFVAAVLLGVLFVGSGLGAFLQDGFAGEYAFHWGATGILALTAAGLCWLASFAVAVIGALVGLIKLLSNMPARRA